MNSLSSFWRKNVLFPISIGIVFTLVLILWLGIYLSNKEAEKTTSITANTLIASIRNNLIVGDELAINTLIASVGRDSKIQIKVLNSFKQELAVYGPNLLNDEFHKLNTFEISNNDGENIGYLQMEQIGFTPSTYVVILTVLVILIMFGLIFIFSIQKISIIISNINNIDEDDHIDESFVEIHNLKEKLQQRSTLLLIKEKTDVQYRLAKQIAHDIKSPLAALEIVMDDIKNLPEDSRELTLHAINRIQDIANNLSKQELIEDVFTHDLPSVLIRSLINEKKIEYQNSRDINLNLIENTDHLNFINCNVSRFMRVLSNIVNNSVESMEKKGDVTIILANTDTEFIVKVEDSGEGFPLELLDKGIAQGRTVGKSNGQGLGLYHALETVQAMGGKLVIGNQVTNGGALVTISIPLVKSPVWFEKSINVSHYDKILVIDDDQSIHDVWNKLIKESGLGIEIIHLYKDDEISSALSEIDNNTAVLIDYDLRSEKTGIDYILEYELKKVVLVTSNYDTPEVVQYCMDNDIQMIPKQIVSSIDIT